MHEAAIIGSVVPAPEHRLKNKNLVVFVLLPDAQHGFYRGPRFDWSGMVRRVEYGGHVFFDRTLGAVPDPSGTDTNAVGTAGEFGMSSPLGYDEALPGETFVKIGVGELRRSDGQEYGFWKPYPIVRSGAWRIQKARNRIAFQQTLIGPRGWAYEYETIITLMGDHERPGFWVSRHLRNRGSKPILTDHYLHHFCGIDTVPFGPAYTVTFPFPASPVRAFRPAGAVEITPSPPGSRLRLIAPTPLPDGKALYGELTGYPGTAAGYAATVQAELPDGKGASISFQGDRPVSAFHVYGTSQVICPEPFTLIRLAPHAELRWEVRYTFSADAA